MLVEQLQKKQNFANSDDSLLELTGGADEADKNGRAAPKLKNVDSEEVSNEILMESLAKITR